MNRSVAAISLLLLSGAAPLPAQIQPLPLTALDPGELSFLLPEPGLIASPKGGTSSVPRHQRPEVAPATASAVAGLNAAGFDVFRQVRAGGGANTLVSPLSFTTAFGLAYAGAAGQTAAEMEHVFGFSGDTASGLGGLMGDLNTDRDGRDLRVVNRLFAAEGLTLRDDYVATTRDAYGAPVERLDFRSDPDASRQRINGWVEDQTNDRIRDLLPKGSVKDDTAIVLTNAVYFNADWKHDFAESATRERPFHLADGSVQSVETMHQTRTFRYGEFDGYRTLEMPYAGDDLAMVVVLPDEAGGLAGLEAEYDAARFAADLEAMSYREVNVALPKFSFDDAQSLKGPLRELGLEAPFDDGADFSRMTDARLEIDDVFHQSFIDVNESGTEAAAATAIIASFMMASYQPPPVAFTADRPFLFAIRDTHTDAVMFLGRMGDPGAAAFALATIPEPSCLVLAGGVAIAGFGNRRGIR